MVNGLMSSATSISAINCVFVIASGIVVLYKRFDHFFTYRDVGQFQLAQISSCYLHIKKWKFLNYVTAALFPYGQLSYSIFINEVWTILMLLRLATRTSGAVSAFNTLDNNSPFTSVTLTMDNKMASTIRRHFGNIVERQIEPIIQCLIIISHES